MAFCEFLEETSQPANGSYNNWTSLNDLQAKYWMMRSTLLSYPEDNQSMLIETSSCNHQFFSELITVLLKRDFFSHGVTANSLYLSSSPFKATNLTTQCHRKQSLLILFTMQSYKSYYSVSPQTVFTYPLPHAKLQFLVHGVTANSLYLSFSPCKATNLTTWCHRKQSLLTLIIIIWDESLHQASQFQQEQNAFLLIQLIQVMLLSAENP